MTRLNPLSDATKREMERALLELGLSLCHVDFRAAGRSPVLTLYIESDAGVTLADCERATHAASAVLDAADEIPESYLLEVSSPGLDRPLWSLADCVRFRGHRVTARLARPVQGTSKLKGTLEAVEGDALTILDEDQRRHYTVRFDDVRLLRLIPEFPELKNIRPATSPAGVFKTERPTR